MFVSLRTSHRLCLIYWHGCFSLVETVFLTNWTVYSTTDKKQEKLLSCIFQKTLFLTWYDVFWSACLSTLEFDGGTYFYVKRLPATLHQWLHLLRTQIFPLVVHFFGLRRLVPDEGSTLMMEYWTRRHDGMTVKVQKAGISQLSRQTGSTRRTP